MLHYCGRYHVLSYTRSLFLFLGCCACDTSRAGEHHKLRSSATLTSNIKCRYRIEQGNEGIYPTCIYDVNARVIQVGLY